MGKRHILLLCTLVCGTAAGFGGASLVRNALQGQLGAPIEPCAGLPNCPVACSAAGVDCIAPRCCDRTIFPEAAMAVACCDGLICKPEGKCGAFEAPGCTTVGNNCVGAGECCPSNDPAHPAVCTGGKCALCKDTGGECVGDAGCCGALHCIHGFCSLCGNGIYDHDATCNDEDPDNDIGPCEACDDGEYNGQPISNCNATCTAAQDRVVWCCAYGDGIPDRWPASKTPIAVRGRFAAAIYA